MVSDKQQFRVSAVASPRFLVTGGVPAGSKGLHPPAPTPQPPPPPPPPPHQAASSSSSKSRPQTAVGAHSTRQGQASGVQKTSASAQHRVPSSAQHDASQAKNDNCGITDRSYSPFSDELDFDYVSRVDAPPSPTAVSPWGDSPSIFTSPPPSSPGRPKKGNGSPSRSPPRSRPRSPRISMTGRGAGGATPSKLPIIEAPSKWVLSGSRPAGHDDEPQFIIKTLQAKSMKLRPQASKDMGGSEAQRHKKVVDEYRELAELQLREMERAEGERAAELLRREDSGRGGGDGGGGGGGGDGGGGDGGGGGGGEARPPGSGMGGIWDGMSVSRGAHVVDILASDGLDKAAGESGTVQPIRHAKTPVRPATSPSKKREWGGGKGRPRSAAVATPRGGVATPRGGVATPRGGGVILDGGMVEGLGGGGRGGGARSVGDLAERPASSKQCRLFMRPGSSNVMRPGSSKDGARGGSSSSGGAGDGVVVLQGRQAGLHPRIEGSDYAYFAGTGVEAMTMAMTMPYPDQVMGQGTIGVSVEGGGGWEEEGGAGTPAVDAYGKCPACATEFRLGRIPSFGGDNSRAPSTRRAASGGGRRGPVSKGRGIRDRDGGGVDDGEEQGSGSDLRGWHAPQPPPPTPTLSGQPTKLLSRPGTEDGEGYSVVGGMGDAAGRRPRSAGTEQSMKPKAKAINSQQRPVSAVSSSIQMRISSGSVAGVGGGGAGGSDGGRTSDDEGSYRTFTRGASSAAAGMPSEGDGFAERGREWGENEEDVVGGEGYGYVYEDRDGGLVGEEERREMEEERVALKEGIGRAMERAEEAERMREEAVGRLENALARVVALEGELEGARGDAQAAKANAEAKMGLRQKQALLSEKTRLEREREAFEAKVESSKSTLERADRVRQLEEALAAREAKFAEESKRRKEEQDAKEAHLLEGGNRLGPEKALLKDDLGSETRIGRS